MRRGQLYTCPAVLKVVALASSYISESLQSNTQSQLNIIMISLFSCEIHFISIRIFSYATCLAIFVIHKKVSKIM